MFFLISILMLTTLLVCYAGYIFLIVDKRAEDKVLQDEETFAALDDKNYSFDIPEEADTYEQLRLTEPPDKRTLPLALLDRAKADIPRIEQLEKDHPRMARLFQKGLLPFHVWEQLLDAEAIMDTEVNSVQGVFSQAYQMLRKEREDEQRMEQLQRESAVLSLNFEKLSGDVVTIQADGRRVSQQTAMVLRKESANEELATKTSVKAELVSGTGEDKRVHCCDLPSLELDAQQEKQWKQIGSDPTGLRLQVRFVRRTHGAKAGFAVEQIRATVPETAATVVAATKVTGVGGS